MAGFVDLDQRLCGCLNVGRGDSYCAVDVSRNQGFPLAAWANRAYGDDTGRLAGISDRRGRFWAALGAGASSCWGVVGRVGVSCCDVPGCSRSRTNLSSER